MRLIDADELLEHVYRDDLDTREKIADLINQMPTITPEIGNNDLITIAIKEPEQKKGKWIYEKINSYTSRTYCSECGKSAPFICVSDDYYGRNMHGETNKTKFCPNCGAEMRGE